MKLTIKNLHGDTYTHEIAENETVRTLKEQIAERNDLKEKYTADLLKFLYTGKVMDDEEMISSFDIKPDGWLLLVKQTPGKPPKPPKKKKPPYPGFNNNMMGFGSQFGMSGGLMHQPFQLDPFSQQSLQADPFMQPSFQQTPFMQQKFQQSTFPTASHFAGAENTGSFPTVNSQAFGKPNDAEEKIQQLVDMGFTRAQAEQALTASFYDVNGAIEYLTSGDMPRVDDDGQPSGRIETENFANPGPTRQRSQPSTGTGSGQEAGMGTSLKDLARLLKEHPEQLQSVKKKLETAQPELAQMIQIDPQGFLELLEQAAETDDDVPASNNNNNNNTPTPTPAPTAAGSGGGTANNPAPTQVKVTLTAQEQQTINEIQDMGFERNRVIEAFLACERNKEMAIEYLLTAFQ